MRHYEEPAIKRVIIIPFECHFFFAAVINVGAGVIMRIMAMAN